MHRPRALDDEVHLLLLRLLVTVLTPRLVRRQHEVVEAERTRAEGTPRLADRASGPLALEAADVDERKSAHAQNLLNRDVAPADRGTRAGAARPSRGRRCHAAAEAAAAAA